VVGRAGSPLANEIFLDLDPRNGIATGTVHRPTDPYEELAAFEYQAPGYHERLKQLGVFDNLDPADVWPAWRAIADAMRWGWQDVRGGNGLRQKAANVAFGSDLLRCHDRSAVSNALAAVADALNIDAEPSRQK
jgi:hypothetical protein